jgi:hypothetical protein
MNGVGRHRRTAPVNFWARHRQRANKRTQSASIRIAAPPDKVWDLITTVASITDWYDTWDNVEHAADDERLQVGTLFRTNPSPHRRRRHRTLPRDLTTRAHTIGLGAVPLPATRRVGRVRSTPRRKNRHPAQPHQNLDRTY